MTSTGANFAAAATGSGAAKGADAAFGVAQAGSIADPVIEMDVIVADTATSSSSGTALVALLAAVLAIPHF